MIDYIKGTVAELNPAELVLESNNIGYSIQISLQTYEVIQGKESVKIYIHHYIREDEELYFGFSSKKEREIFRQLISVSGVGVSTARMVLSSLTSEELESAILSEDVNRIKSVKGLGVKTAQRIILELKDKIVKGGGESSELFAKAASSAETEEATIALVMLGFTKANINKVLPGILKDNPGAKVETIIKEALKRL